MASPTYFVPCCKNYTDTNYYVLQTITPVHTNVNAIKAFLTLTPKRPWKDKSAVVKKIQWADHFPTNSAISYRLFCSGFESFRLKTFWTRFQFNVAEAFLKSFVVFVFFCQKMDPTKKFLVVQILFLSFGLSVHIRSLSSWPPSNMRAFYTEGQSACKKVCLESTGICNPPLVFLFNTTPEFWIC